MSTETRVRELPYCNFCGAPATYDAKTASGPWANLCEEHFAEFGIGLGTGFGQRLVVWEEKPPGAKDLAGRPLTYEQWERLVDRVVISKVGLSCADLEDWNSYDCYESGMSPEDAAEECLSNSDTYSMFRGE